MRKKISQLLLLVCCLIFLSGNIPFATGAPFTVNESTVPLTDILLYCNTPEFIRNMAEDDYKLGVAASGVINDDRHKMLVSMDLLMNPRNRQWAIIFNYAKGNFSCIIGGNRISLYKPQN